MSPQTPDIQALLDRLQRVERINRRLSRFAIAVMLILGAILVCGQTSPQPKTVEATEIILRDLSGKTRGRVGVDGLTFFASDGKKRVTLGIEMVEMTTFLRLYDRSERVRAALGLAGDSPILGLTSDTGDIYIGSSGADPPGLSLNLRDEKGIARAILGSTSTVTARTEIVEKRPPSSLLLFDKDGRVVWRAP